MMMRALGEFIMGGRLQAAVPILLGVPVISQAVIALVSLRKGAYEGLLLVVLGLFPAFVALALGRPYEVIFWVRLLIFLAVCIPALCLRATASWPFALVAMIIASVFPVIAVAHWVPAVSNEFAEMTSTFLAVMPGSAPVQDITQLPVPTMIELSGFLSLSVLTAAISGLVLGRWWQALLYNPGGFGDEFRQLRVGMAATIACTLAAIFCLLQGRVYGLWAAVFLLPLIMVALAIFHQWVAVKKIDPPWVAGFYIVCIFLTATHW